MLRFVTKCYALPRYYQNIAVFFGKQLHTEKKALKNLTTDNTDGTDKKKIHLFIRGISVISGQSKSQNLEAGQLELIRRGWSIAFHARWQSLEDRVRMKPFSSRKCLYTSCGELLTDLTVIFHGLGIFSANHPAYWHEHADVWPDIDIPRPEYMTPPMQP